MQLFVKVINTNNYQEEYICKIVDCDESMLWMQVFALLHFFSICVYVLQLQKCKYWSH